MQSTKIIQEQVRTIELKKKTLGRARHSRQHRTRTNNKKDHARTKTRRGQLYHLIISFKQRGSLKKKAQKIIIIKTDKTSMNTNEEVRKTAQDGVRRRKMKTTRSAQLNYYNISFKQ